MIDKKVARSKKEFPIDLYGELWNDIKYFKDWYSSSNTGRIKSLSRTVIYSNGGIRDVPSFLVKGSLSKNGYLRVALYKNGSAKYFSIHRLVAETFIPNPDNLPQVNHINGIKTDNSVENLEWSSCENNTRHAWKNSLCTSPMGELNNKSKLTEKQVLEIRSLKGMQSHLSISKLYGVSRISVTNILNRKSWTHI